MNRPTAAVITAAAVNLLRAGVLPSNLPGRLMADYSLTSTEARKLAGRALAKWKSETRPRAGSGGKRPGE